MEINNNTPWQDMTKGGTIYDAGNSKTFKTGDWRSMNQYFIQIFANNVGYVSQFAQKMQFQ